MARIRTIKPDFWSDEKMANVCMQARLLYIGLWNLSDDYGVCKGNPNWIKSQLFAYDEITKDQMVTWLKELEFLGRIVPFDANGETFYNLPNFLKHQRIKNPSEFRNVALPQPYPSPTEALPQPYGSPTPALPQPFPTPTPSKVRYSKVMEGMVGEEPATASDVDKSEIRVRLSALEIFNDWINEQENRDKVATLTKFYGESLVRSELLTVRAWLTANDTKAFQSWSKNSCGTGYLDGILPWLNAWMKRSRDKPQKLHTPFTAEQEADHYESHKRDRATTNGFERIGE